MVRLGRTISNIVRELWRGWGVFYVVLVWIEYWQSIVSISGMVYMYVNYKSAKKSVSIFVTIISYLD